MQAARSISMRNVPAAMWTGIALIVISSAAHVWLEYDRGTRIAPQLRQARARGWIGEDDARVVPTELGRRFTNDVIALFLQGDPF